MRYVKSNWTAILAIVSAVLGMTGFLLAKDVGSATGWPLVLLISDGLFFTIKLFGGGGPESLFGSGGSTGFAEFCLNVSRFTAPLSLVSAFLARFDGLWRPYMARQFLFRLRRSDLIFGDSSAAKRFHAANITVKRWTILAQTADDKRDQPADVDFARRTVSIGYNELAKASATGKMRVAHTVVASSKDLENITICKSGPIQLVESELTLVHVADEELRLNIVAAGGIVGNPTNPVQVTSEHELEARAFFHSVDFFIGEYAKGRKCAHLALIGFGDDAKAFVLQFLKVAPHPDLGTPKVTVFSYEPKSDKSFIDRRIPSSLGLVDVDVVEMAFSPDYEAMLAQVTKTDPVGLVYLSERADGQQQRFAFELAALAERTSSAAAMICLKGTASNRLWVEQMRHYSMWPIRSLTLDDQHLSTSALSGDIDKLAQAIHAAYRGYKLSISGETPSDVMYEWLSLDENLRASNRRAADSAKTKLEALGVTGTSFPGVAHLPEVSEARLEALAEAEHKSWMADRFINGWRLGELRDNKRRLHHNLVPYCSMTEADKELDRRQVQTVLRMLSEPLV